MRLGLLAMSGVRVIDPDLAWLGVTLPQFVARGHVVASLPSLSLLTLAALTPEDVEVEYVEIPHIADLNTRRLPDFDAVADLLLLGPNRRGLRLGRSASSAAGRR